MRHLFFTIISFALLQTAIAQEHHTGSKDAQSLSERLNIVEKKTDKFNMYFNFQGSFDSSDNGDATSTSNFRASNLRLEIKGNLTDKLFYRLRHKLNSSNQANTRDNLAGATDIFYAGYHFNDKFTFIFGKQCQYWGGFEYDLNPIFIHQFSDFNSNIDCFMLGATLVYNIDKNNELAFQITDSRANKFEDFYGNITNLEKSRTPLTYILNWNGNLWNNIIKTRWAVGLQTDARDKHTYSTTMGTMLNLPKFQLAFDYMMDNSDIDRLGIATQYTGIFHNNPNPHSYIAEDIKYNTFIAKAEYQPTKKWNLFAKGFYETTDAKNMPSSFRKSYGYLAGAEYIPFADQDMRLFLTYVGQRKEFDNIGVSNYNTNRVSLGLIYRIKAF